MREATVARWVTLACAALSTGCATTSESPDPAPLRSPAAVTATIDESALTTTSASEPPPGALPAPRASTPARTPHEALDAGVRWLIEHQNANGSFGTFETLRRAEIYLDNLSSHRAFHVATSALATAALIDPARRDPDAAAALDRALDWILAAPPTGRATGETFYNTWAHTYLLELAAAVLAEPRLAARHDAFRALAEREVALTRAGQSGNGGWGYYDFGEALTQPTGRLSTSFNTAAMILALRAVERQGIRVPPALIRDGLVCLKRMTLPNGSYSYGIYVELVPQAVFNQVRGASGRLQVCNLARYVERDGVDDAALGRGLAQLRDHHHYIALARGRMWPHETYYANSGYYYYFGHYYAARVAAAMAPSQERDELAAWLAGVFVRDQSEDGAWFDFPLYGYGHAYATGYAVLAMTALMPLLDAAPSPAPKPAEPVAVSTGPRSVVAPPSAEAPP